MQKSVRRTCITGVEPSSLYWHTRVTAGFYSNETRRTTYATPQGRIFTSFVIMKYLLYVHILERRKYK